MGLDRKDLIPRLLESCTDQTVHVDQLAQANGDNILDHRWRNSHQLHQDQVIQLVEV